MIPYLKPVKEFPLLASYEDSSSNTSSQSYETLKTYNVRVITKK